MHSWRLLPMGMSLVVLGMCFTQVARSLPPFQAKSLDLMAPPRGADEAEAPHEEVQRLGQQKLFFSLLQHVAQDGNAAVLLSPTNLPYLQQLLTTTLQVRRRGPGRCDMNGVLARLDRASHRLLPSQPFDCGLGRDSFLITCILSCCRGRGRVSWTRLRPRRRGRV
jgi:hypothetical protein